MSRHRITAILSLGLLLFLLGCNLLQGGQATVSPPQQPGTTPVGQQPPQTTEVTATGPCANPYFPVADGVTRTYQLSADSTFTATKTETISNVGADGFTLNFQVDEVNIAQQWACRPEGLVSLDYASGSAATLSTSGTSAQYTTLEVTGVTVPAEISSGDTWSQSYQIQGTETLPGDLTGSTEGTITLQFQAVGMESVTVPAGAFQALKVAVSTDFNFSVTVEGVTVPLTYGSTGFWWLAPGVGIVKISEEGELFEAPFTGATELTAYSIP